MWTGSILWTVKPWGPKWPDCLRNRHMPVLPPNLTNVVHSQHPNHCQHATVRCHHGRSHYLLPREAECRKVALWPEGVWQCDWCTDCQGRIGTEDGAGIQGALAELGSVSITLYPLLLELIEQVRHWDRGKSLQLDTLQMASSRETDLTIGISKPFHSQAHNRANHRGNSLKTCSNKHTRVRMRGQWARPRNPSRPSFLTTLKLPYVRMWGEKQSPRLK